MAYQTPGNRMQRTPSGVLNLLIINGLVFLAQSLIKDFDLTSWGSLYYIKSPMFHPHQFITSLFMHANFEHIAFNMFGLWMFGTILERFWGSKKFLIFYFACGLGAGIFEQLLASYDALQMAKQTQAYLNHEMPLQEIAHYIKLSNSTLGASGAIMGLFAAFAYLFPNTELYIMFIPIPVKAKYVIPFFVLLDLFGGFYRIQGDNIGHFAHLGGALVGFLIVFIGNKTNRRTFY